MGEKRSPKLLKKLLIEPVALGTSQGSANTIDQEAAERARQALIKRRKKEKDFIDSVVAAVSSNRDCSDALNVAVCRGADHETCLAVVTTKTLYYHEPAKHISRLRLVLHGDGNYYIQVFLTTVEEGNITTPEEFVNLCERLVDNKNYKFCPGIDTDEYEQFKEVIKYDPKRVKITDLPVKRVASSGCKLWFHTTGRGISKQVREPAEMLCRECCQLKRYLQTSARRISSVPAEKLVKREQPDSMYPMKYLSPESLARRKMNIKTLKAKEKRKAKKYSSGETSFVLPSVVPVENMFNDNDVSVTPPS